MIPYSVLIRKSDLCVLQILCWPVFHTEQNSLKQIEAKDGEALEQQSIALLSEAERTDKPQRWMDVLHEGVGMDL